MANNSITLFGFYKDADKPSASGFCQKLETFLRASSYTSYTHVATWPNKAPKGKLPYITLVTSKENDPKSATTTTIADSTFIINLLISSGITPDPDAALSPTQKADSRAFQAWLEEFVYHTVVYSRWARPANYVEICKGLPIPWPFSLVIPGYIRRGILNSIKAHGVGRHTDEEMDGLMKEFLDALEIKLEAAVVDVKLGDTGAGDGGKFAWFHGTEKPTLIDITVAGFLMNALGYDSNPEYTALILAHPRVREFAKVTTKMWFPEYEGVLRVIAEYEVAQT